ncbi:MAG: Diacylglycerol kinase [Candidatus Curtissbacteria bacterium GW2011_GWA1_40_16]|uniref:Diacylglycerol kinase n=1 Tax=Candidatus Curtissbacteria bacterium GW2011_GWA1_40_16 TaxID=1618405 RepID=A0A0G0UM81_9BACT|nr:MAG: Diacylglycerol kinase [Candidatus Curtissbacteria bacterium GW2011_GWA1_40_16]
MTGSVLKAEKKSFTFALEGIAYAIKTQLNFKIQITAGLLAILAAFILGFDRGEWLVLLIVICLVLSAELANTVIETVVDLAMPDVHPKAKTVKDLSAGVVLLVSAFAVLIGLVLFYPHIALLFG